ncbi:MAG: hypothetical protein ACREUN_15155 [Burkholderiales bacterium]
MRRRRQQLGGHASMVLLAMVLSACTMVGHRQVAGWPRMEVVEHYVPEARLREVCAKYVGFGMSPQACAEFRFVQNRCDLWFSADFPPSRSMVEHERLHCQGYDHIGMRTMADLLAAHRGEASASAGATRK